MRGSPLLVIAAFAVGTLAGPAAQARQVVDLFGFLAAPLHAMSGSPGMRTVRLPRQHRAVVRTRLAAPERAAAPAPLGKGTAGPPGPAADIGMAPSLWPSFHAETYDEIVGYALWPQEYADAFWGHGAGDLVDAIFPTAPEAADDRMAGRRSSTRLAKAETASTVGSGEADTGLPASAGDGLCGQGARALASRPLDRLLQALELDDVQRGAFDKLRTALLQEIDNRRADCPPAAPATAIERLKAMKAALWSVRNVGIFIRTPLKNFYEALSGDQKTRFRADAILADAQDAHDARAPRAARIDPRGRAAGICGRAGRGAEWPSEAIRQSIEPSNDDQRASLEKLRATYEGLSRALTASCPASLPMTPLERLDAADNRLLALASASMTMNAALADFYGRLTDDQKQRFNLLRR